MSRTILTSGSNMNTVVVVVAVCLLGVVATVRCSTDAAIHKSSSDNENEANKATDSLVSSPSASKRDLSDDADVETLVSSDRAPRNSYVRFGRSYTDLAEDLNEPSTMSAVAKRSKNYVRFGRDGRQYVRFGRSPLGAAPSPSERREHGGEDLVARRASGERHYVRFGRRDEGPEFSAPRFRRSLRGHGSRADQSSAQRSARNERQPASKHYVRFGRSDIGGARVAADEAFVESNLDLDDAVETVPHQMTSLVEDDKRSGNKHYVRFGRRSQQSPNVVDGGDYEDFDDVDEDGSPVGKRSKNYVRFGRSGTDDDNEDETIEEIDKRADYIRFG